MDEADRKNEAIARMVILLNMIFKAIDEIGVTFCTAKDGSWVFQDEETGYVRKLTPEGVMELHKVYERTTN